MRMSAEEKQLLGARCMDGESAAEICADAEVARSTFYSWIKPFAVTKTDSGCAVNQQEFIKVKQKIQKLEQKVEILSLSVNSQKWTGKHFLQTITAQANWSKAR